MTTNDAIKTTILLLVSDPISRSVFKETLEHEGYTVLAAADLGQAVDWLKECTPDLLITRAYVSSMTGHDAAIYLRERCHRMKVLMLGGLLDDSRLTYRAELEGFAVFPNPYSSTEMLHKIEEVLNTTRG